MLRKQFWRDVIGDAELITRHRDHINRLLQGQFQGQLERIRVEKNLYVYVSRLNAADRLLYATITANNIHYLFVLEEVLNHDYQKATFLKPNALKDYLANHAEEILTQVANLTKQANEQATTANNQKAKIKLARVELDSGNLIALSDKQEIVLSHPCLEDFNGALVLLGPPGSGKTTVALSILKDIALRAAANERYVYVTKSARLVQQVRSKLSDFPQIECKTIAEIELTLNPERARRKPVNATYHHQWLKTSYLPHLRDLARTSQKNITKESISELENFEKVYEEYRTVSGLTQEKYLLLSTEKCLFPKECRAVLFDTFTNYLTHLKENNSYDAEFEDFTVPERPLYTFMLLDEAMDCTNGEFNKLNRLSQSICVLSDPKQDLYNSISNLRFIVDELKKTREVFIEPLTESFRSPAKPAALINKMIQLRNTVVGGVLDPVEAKIMEVTVDPTKPGGDVVWFDGYDEKWVAESKKTQKETEYSVITYAKYFKEAEALFGAGLVFLPEGFKGLEDRTIACYRLFDEPAFNMANKILSTIPAKDYGKHLHKPKAGEANKEFLILFHRVITALSRATERIYLFQKKDKHRLKAIIDYLDPPADNTARVAATINPALPQDTTKENWQERITKLIDNGNHEQARKLYVAHGFGTEETFAKKYQTHVSLPPRIEERTSTKQVASTQSPVIARAKQTVSNVDKEYDYVNGLFNKFTESNLKNLITHKLCIQLLFGFSQRGIKGHDSLFDAIISDDDKTTLLLDAINIKNYENLSAGTTINLKDNKIGLTFFTKLAKDLLATFTLGKHAEKSLEPEPLPSVFARLSSHTIGQNILLLLFILVPDLLAETPPAILFTRTRSKEPCSPFIFLLANAHEGHKIIQRLFNETPDLIDHMPVDELNYVDSNGPTGFFYLVNSPFVTQLNAVFNRRPELSKGLKNETLYQLLQLVNGEHVSPFHQLLFIEGGLILLETILKTSPELYLSLPERVLFEEVSHSSIKASAFFRLTQTEEGINLLSTIFTKSSELNPDKRSTKPSESLLNVDPLFFTSQLSKALFDRVKTREGLMTAFFLLTRTDNGLKFISKLLEQQPELIENFPKAIMYYRSPASFLLLNLAQSASSYTILADIFNKNPNLVKELPEHVLFGHISLPYELEVSPFSSLLSEKTANLLMQIIKQCDCISERTLKSFLFTKVKLKVTTTYFHYFVEISYSAVKVISDRYPNFFADVPLEPLCAPIYDASGLAYPSTLFLLSGDSQLEDIERIMSVRPDLLKHLTAEYLCKSIGMHTPDQSNTSLLNIWLKSEKGRELIEKWLTVHPNDKAEVEAQIREYQRQTTQIPVTLTGLAFFSTNNSEQNADKHEPQTRPTA